MWRLLENGEQIIEGDEYFDYDKPHRKGGKWKKCGDFYLWMTVSDELLHPIRRKISQEPEESPKTPPNTESFQLLIDFAGAIEVYGYRSKKAVAVWRKIDNYVASQLENVS